MLASTSAARQALLQAAGLQFEAVAPRVDEDAAKYALKEKGFGARDIADALAELKALRVSASRQGDIVLGCDQTLMLEDGTMLDKPGADVSGQLRQLSGRTHVLYSAVVAALDGRPIWRHVDRARLTMRPLSDRFIEDYVGKEGGAVASCVGGYRIEGLGIQLFSKIEGNHFTIIGLSLLPLLEWLRLRGILTS